MLIAVFLLLGICAFGQNEAPKQTATISYSLDTIRRDSFFLIETFSTTKADSPRPVETVTPQLFQATEQLDAYVNYLEDEAKKANEQAQKYAQAAQLAGLRAQLITQLKTQHNWWGANTPTTLKPIPDIQETKPAKKKRATKKQ